MSGVPKVTFCNDSVADLIVNSYHLDPDNIQGNENVTFTLNAVLNKKVTGGVIDVKAKVGFIPIYDQQTDLCEDLKKGNMSCPLQAKPYLIDELIQIPGVPVHGRVEATINLYDQDDEELLCMRVECQI